MKPCKILFLASNPTPTGRLALDEEARDIEIKIRGSEHRDFLILKTRWAVRTDDLIQALNEDHPMIVHFSGHGSGAPGIALHDETGGSKLVSADALKRLFSACKDDIRIVVLNACHSSDQARTIADVVDCVVGMNDAVGDRAARRFAASFYRALGFGKSVKAAFEQGLVAIGLDDLGYQNVPSLVMRPGVNAEELFVVQEPSATSALPDDSNMQPRHLEAALCINATQVEQGALVIDDVFTSRKWRHVRLDVRVRNASDRVVSISRADVHILERDPCAGFFKFTAFYRVVIDGEHNIVKMSQRVAPNDIDRFAIRVGFTKYNSSCSFVAALILTYNDGRSAVSKPFKFDSHF